MLNSAAPLAGVLLLTALGGGNRMNFEQQPGLWLVYQSIILDSKLTEETESRVCLTGWTQRTPEDFLEMTARGATCEITGRDRDGGMMNINYACTDGPVQQGRIRIGGSLEDLTVMAEAMYTLEDGRVVPAFIDTMFLFERPCDAALTEAGTAPGTE